MIKKRIVSLIITAAMFFSSAVPIVSAQNTSDEPAQLMALPTPIPSPTPAPPEIGDTYDFEEYDKGMILHLDAVETPVYTQIRGFKLHVNARSAGAEVGTNAAIADGAGIDGSKALQINYNRFADVNRGPRIELVEPEVENYKVSFKAIADETQDIIVSDSTTVNGDVQLGVSSAEWSVVDIYMYNGQRYIVCDGTLIETKAAAELPVLWGLDESMTGSFYIDNYTISEITNQDIANAYAAALEITNERDTVYWENDAYSFIESFPVTSESNGTAVEWAVAESTDGGMTWTATTDLTASKVEITATAPLTEKLYKLIGTVKFGEATGSKSFILRYVEADVTGIVAERLDIISDEYEDEVEKRDDRYIIRGDFKVPTSDWVTTIDWASSDAELIAIEADGTVTVYPKDGTQVTLTATISYNGKLVTKDFLLDLANYHTSVTRWVQLVLEKETTVAVKGTDGKNVSTVELSNGAVISHDVELETDTWINGVSLSWSSSDESVFSNEGEINVKDTSAKAVVLTKTASYMIGDVVVYAESKPIDIIVQFDPETALVAAETVAAEYAMASDVTLTEATVKDSPYYASAMEMLYDRYIARFNAAADGVVEIKALSASWADGVISAELEINSLAGYMSCVPTAVAVVYDKDGRLVEIVSQGFDIPYSESVQTKSITVPAADVADGSCRLMIWDSLQNACPITDAVVL